MGGDVPMEPDSKWDTPGSVENNQKNDDAPFSIDEHIQPLMATHPT